MILTATHPGPASPARPARARLRRAGMAVVEFAVVAPLLFMMVCGMIEFARAFMVCHQLNDASRQGARIGVLTGSTSAGVRAAVTSQLTRAGITGGTTALQVNGNAATDVGAAVTGDAVSVTVSVPFANVTWLPTTWFLGGANLSSTTVMRRE